MGTYSKSNFGQISGKVGNGVAGKWRGIDYLRSLPTKSKRAKSPAQQAVQAKLALAVTQLRPIKDILNIGFGDKKLDGLSGYNAAVRAFINNNILGDYPNYTIDYPKMVLSKGSLGALFTSSLQYDEKLSFTWAVTEETKTTFETDQVIVVVFNQAKELHMVQDSARRNAGAVELNVPVIPGETLHVWAFGISQENQTTSKSEYVGSFTL